VLKVLSLKIDTQIVSVVHNSKKLKVHLLLGVLYESLLPKHVKALGQFYF
jgi:hypothetical protein